MSSSFSTGLVSVWIAATVVQYFSTSVLKGTSSSALTLAALSLGFTCVSCLVYCLVRRVSVWPPGGGEGEVRILVYLVPAAVLWVVLPVCLAKGTDARPFPVAWAQFLAASWSSSIICLFHGWSSSTSRRDLWRRLVPILLFVLASGINGASLVNDRDLTRRSNLSTCVVLYGLRQLSFCLLCYHYEDYARLTTRSWPTLMLHVTGLATVVVTFLAYCFDNTVHWSGILRPALAAHMTSTALVFLLLPMLVLDLGMPTAMVANLAAALLLVDLLSLNWRVPIDGLANVLGIAGLCCHHHHEYAPETSIHVPRQITMEAKLQVDMLSRWITRMISSSYTMILAVSCIFLVTSWSDPYRVVLRQTTRSTKAMQHHTPLDSGSVILNYTKVATMIEKRDMPILVPLLTQYLAIAPLDWPFVVWVSDENLSTLTASAPLARELESGRLNLTILPDWVDVSDGEHLSRFLTRPWFWEQFHAQAEWMFFFQSDAVLCSRSSQTIDDWLGYDFVGGPCFWSDSDGDAGGNGGLSMRKISSAQTVTRDRATGFARVDITQQNAKQYFRTPHEAEDWWFLWAMKEKIKDPRFPADDGRHQNTFSIAFPGLAEPMPLACHRGSGDGMGFLQEPKSRDYQKLIEWCPEILMLKSYAEGAIRIS